MNDENDLTAAELLQALLVSRRETMSAHIEILKFQIKDITVKLENMDKINSQIDEGSDRNK